MAENAGNAFWNPVTREFWGRTAHGWWLLLLFYLAFYLFLAGLFAGCMYVMLLTLSPYTPKYRERVSPPAYNDSVQESKNIVCTPGSYFIQDNGECCKKQACQFKRSILDKCSGLTEKTFGYALGQPCILLKMNRIIGYRPGYGTPVTVECKTRQKTNASTLQAVDFFPSSTFDPMYFPYYGKRLHENYTSPLVGMQFTIEKNQTVNIQCQLHGVGIINNNKKDHYLGRVWFSLTVND